MINLSISRTLGLILLFVAVFAISSTGGVAAQPADTIVAQDGSGDYTSIQNAVDDANDTDRIEIQTGKYKESIYIDKNVTIITTKSATIANASTVADRSAIEISKSAKPAIDGIDITGWMIGIEADFSENNWKIRNVTIDNTTRGINAFNSNSWEIANTTIEAEDVGISLSRNNGAPVITKTHISDSTLGIIARRTSGEPLIRETIIKNVSSGISMFKSTGESKIVDTKIENVDDGVGAYKSSGNWRIENTTITNVSDDAVSAGTATGDWQLQNVNITNAGGDGVYAANTINDWQIQNTLITGVDDAVDAEDATGDWQVKNTSITNAADDGFDAANTVGDWKIETTTINKTQSEGIFAENTSGNWTISDSRVVNINDNSIEVDDSTGAWEVRDTTVRNAQNGIETEDATNDWQVTNLTVHDVTRDGIDASRTTGDWNVTDSEFTAIGIAAIEADETEGGWRVTNSILTNGTGTAVNANDAVVEGSVGYNYWGAADGPAPRGSGGEAFGNLSISPGFYADAQLTNLIRPFAAPVIFAPSDGSYDPSSPHTIGTSHNATGVISSDDLAIRLVNVTDQNRTVVAVNDSSTIPVDTGGNTVNTTIPAGALSGDVQIETQLYNTSAGTVKATDTINLAAATGPGDITGNGAAAQDPDGDGLYEDINGDGRANLQDLQPFFAYINPAATNPTQSGLDFNNDGSMNLRDLQPFFNEVSP